MTRAEAVELLDALSLTLFFFKGEEVLIEFIICSSCSPPSLDRLALGDSAVPVPVPVPLMGAERLLMADLETTAARLSFMGVGVTASGDALDLVYCLRRAVR